MNLKDRLKKGVPAIGSWINTASPIVAELMAKCGFHFLTVDVEHSAVDLSQVQQLFQAIKAGNFDCAPLVRMQGNEYSETKRYLDAGAAGVVAPLINNVTQAEELIRAVKYPPEGMRGVGFCRANAYGSLLQEVVEKANEEVFVCIQIEHIKGVANIDSILSLNGIDAVMIGPYDLSASMGITGKFDHPDMVKVTDIILKACKKHSVIAGIHVVQPNIYEVERRYSEGYRFIAYSLDITMLLSKFSEDLNEIKKRIKINERDE